uniref:peptidoglycan recognition protein family protein n=1 Tax=Streptomyces corallincola TaxID=2851888 RepID=UPI001FEA7FC8|nr:N-acetylmuramoyl-L-alanine amidase [Streptomyces corallincola]
MRGLFSSSVGATSIGVTCAVALALPLALPATAAPAHAERTAATGRTAEAAVPGRTESLPLAPRTRERVLGQAPEQGLYRASVDSFSMLGVIWDDPDTPLRGRVQVRTRDTATGTWSGWQDVDTHNEDHGADPGTAERAAGHVRGATAPLWVGDSDGVDVRVRAEATGPDGPAGPEDAGGPRTRTAAFPLPAGLRLELVDPGAAEPAGGTRAVTAPETDAAVTAEAANSDVAPAGALEIPALDRAATEKELAALAGDGPRVKPHIGPRPKIVTRHGWGADEKLRERGFVYTKKVKAAFVHHTATGNKYTCSQAPSVIRGIYRYHVKSMGWRDIGYNFLVDKCGTVYEGRAGGVTKAVLGAHTMGFNTNSMGIAVIGSFGSAKPPAAAVTGVGKIVAWKLGLFAANPSGKTYLTSGGGNLYPKGKNVRLNVISGHRDGYSTDCPGKRLYAKLGSVRSKAAKLQGR